MSWRHLRHCVYGDVDAEIGHRTHPLCFVTIASIIFENANADVDSKCEWALSIRELFRTLFIDWGIS